MGQHQNQPEHTQQIFESLYEENMTQEYFTHTKGFGYRKTNIKSTNPRKILPLLKKGWTSLEEHKSPQNIILKRLFQSSTYPYSCIGLIIVSYKDRCSFGTGCLIGPSLVFTAASNVYHKQTDEQPTVIRFVLGINEGAGDVYRVKANIHIPEKYIQEVNGSHRYNYAVLEIERQELPNEESGKEENKISSSNNQPGFVYGYLGVNTRFSGLENIFIYGYSIQSGQNNEVNFFIRGQKIDKLMCKYGSISYKMDSSQSECGSPILIRRNEYFHIVGIHICGKKGLGTGLQFDQDMRKTLNGWITAKQGRMNLSNQSLDWKTITHLNTHDWQNLTVLNLDNNRLMSSGLIVFSKSSWPMLRELHMCNNEISKLEFQASAVQNLQVFYLTKNQIKDIIILAELPILRVLDLSENRIETMDDLITLKYLERLYLSNQYIDTDGNKLSKIPTEIQKLTELKKFELSRNLIEVVPSEILKLKNLSVISLDGNNCKLEINSLKVRLEENNVEVILK